jgi:predicted TIM-barrel fold metal-dependent hydrolase
LGETGRLDSMNIQERFMVIDCHYHLEERVFNKAVLIEEMDGAGIDKVALMGSMIAPFHEPPRFLLEILQFLLEHRPLRGIAKLLAANFTEQGDVKILGKPHHIFPDPDNKAIFDAVKENPNRFLGWVFVNPKGKNDPIAELQKYLDAPGFIGVKAHPFWHHFAPIELVPVAEMLSRLGKPLLIHCGFGEEGDFDALLMRVPNLKLILAHAGFPEYSDTWKSILKKKNVYLDLSQTSYVSEKATRKVVSFLGPERLIFGTDGPYGFHDENGRYDYGFIKRRIESIFPQDKSRRMLLGENFAALIGMA